MGRHHSQRPSLDNATVSTATSIDNRIAMKLSKLTSSYSAVKESNDAPSVVEVSAPISAVNKHETFLKNFLGDGPRMRVYVYREAEDNKLAWEDIKVAFATLRGREYVQKGEYFWRIMPD